MSTTFPAEVVTAVCAHMNTDHVEDSLMIVQSLGQRPDAIAASMTGLDEDAAMFTVTVSSGDVAAGGEGTLEVRVPWSARIGDRAQIRAEVVRMYHDACAALGVEPRAAAEH